MKKEFRHRLWAWVLLISLAYPITVNFAHSFAEHNLNHARALTQIDNVKGISCAVFHYIHNYNVPLGDTSFELKIPECDIHQPNFLVGGFIKISHRSLSLRAPPIC